MPRSSDASVFTRFRRAVAIQGGDTPANDPKSVNRLSSYATNLSAASSLTEFLSKSKGVPTTTPPPPPSGLITQIDFVRGVIDLASGPIVYAYRTGVFTKDHTDSTRLDSGVNYQLYRINVIPGREYDITLTDPNKTSSDGDIFLSYGGQGFSSAHVIDIANWDFGYSNAVMVPQSVFLYSALSMLNESIYIPPSNDSFYDLLVVSYGKGGWELTVSEIISTPLVPIPLAVNQNVQGTFLSSVRQIELTENSNYKLYRINLSANVDYLFVLGPTSSGSDPDIYIGKPNIPLTLRTLTEIKNGFNLLNYVSDYSGGSGNHIINFSSPTAGFYDVLILSEQLGDWSLVVDGPIVPTPLLVGVQQTEELTGDFYDDPIVQDVTYKLYTINLAANITYTFKLILGMPSDADLYIGKPNVLLTESNVNALKLGQPVSSFIERFDTSTSGGPVIPLTTTTAAFYNILIVSANAGPWNFIVQAPPITTATFSRSILVEGTPKIGTFTKDSQDSTTLFSGLNYRLCRVNAIANETYRVILESITGNTYMVSGALDAQGNPSEFTQQNIIDIANYYYNRPNGNADSVEEPLISNQSTKTAGPFTFDTNTPRDFLIISDIKGDYSLRLVSGAV